MYLQPAEPRRSDQPVGMAPNYLGDVLVAIALGHDGLLYAFFIDVGQGDLCQGVKPITQRAAEEVCMSVCQLIFPSLIRLSSPSSP